MTRNKKIILSVCAVLSLAGASTALAFVVTGCNKNISASTDKSVVLAYGDNSVDAITALAPLAPVTRSVVVNAANATSGLTGYQKITFSLADSTVYGESGLTKPGVTVSIATASWATEGTTAIATINDTANTATQYLALANTATYYLKFSIDQTTFDTMTASNITLNANLNVNLTYSETNA
jgi:hypothetical protein